MSKIVRTLALVLSLVAACVTAAPASGRTVLLGRSWQGRPIGAIEVGSRTGTPVLVVGRIHGNETGGIAISRALERVSPRWDLVWPIPDAVIELDHRILLTEAAQLLAPGVAKKLDLPRDVKPLDIVIVPLPPTSAEQMFKLTAWELGLS